MSIAINAPEYSDVLAARETIRPYLQPTPLLSYPALNALLGIVIKAKRPETRVVAVQSAQAPAGHESWRAGELLTAAMSTMAEGLATASGYEMPQAMLRESLDDFILVDDSEIESAIAVYAESCHAIAEHAGAAALAGAIKDRERLRGRKVAVVLSRANITVPRLRQALGWG